MFHIILYQPEIPPNTGNIIRLCANTGTTLHLIHPLGFDLNEKSLRRAGLDYRDMTDVFEYATLHDCLSKIQPPHVYACSTKGKHYYTEPHFEPGDAFLFGPETRGLPADLLAELSSEQVLRVPMLADSRSLNLSNSAAIILYEAWRQHGFQQANNPHQTD
jgi:tRNA (cytidine/uridine-2'-O-)-methyltransferase